MSERDVIYRIERNLRALRGSQPDPDPYRNRKDDRGIGMAFELASRNVRNRDHWAEVLRAMANGCFPRLGGPRKWNRPELRELLKAVTALRNRNPRLSDLAACNVIHKSGRFEGATAQTLRRKLSEARKHRRK